jgi:molybdopterin-synthase adenylyltransferase
MKLMEYLDSHKEENMIFLEEELKASKLYHLSLREVEEKALEMGILPMRYRRNQNTIPTAEQLVLLRSSAAVIGCGGLGGYIIEELARLGVGRIILVDPDIFVEHNLNRQVLSSVPLLGMAKVEVAARRIVDINPVVMTVPFREAFTREKGKELLESAQVVLDGLDTIEARLDVAEICSQLEVPFIHGAIGGWYGQVMTQKGGGRAFQAMYGKGKRNRGLEQMLGNPSFTPAVIASIQAAEAAKVLLGKESSLENNLLLINLLENETCIMPVGVTKREP